MKKWMICFCVAAGMFACNNNSKDSAATEEKDVTDDPAFVAGRDLVNKSGCFACHKIDEVSIGPAYRKVAEKYPNTAENISKLADKVINGGSGNWGTVPMQSHPGMSKDTAEIMVKYILMLKK